MKHILAISLFWITVHHSVSATDWKLVNEAVRVERTEPNLLYTKRMVQSIPGRVTTVELAFFSSADFRLEVIDLPPKGGNNATDFRQAFVNEECLAGVNGGFFTPENKPLGLVVADGKRVGSFQTTKLLSGVVYCDSKGIHIVRRSAFKDHSGITGLLQTGPFLIENDQPIRGLDATKSRRRTFIATDWRGNWAIGVTSPLSLAALAEVLASSVPVTGWKANRAINLDGGSSTGFYFDHPDEADLTDPPWKSVRNLLGIQPK